MNVNINEKVVYNVRDIQKLLGIGRNTAYDLVKSNQFPVRKAGSNYIIPKIGFENWLNGTDKIDITKFTTIKDLNFK